jgi:hypothetical protein
MSVAGHGSQNSQSGIIRAAVLTDIEPLLSAFEELMLPLIWTQRMPKTRRTGQIDNGRKLGSAVLAEVGGHGGLKFCIIFKIGLFLEEVSLIVFRVLPLS